ncbi:nucleolin-like [Gossypium australe]|uniref:Nucleolin-like n=1 Tax=Gossypium australe TaxID=47621 RepID=A0A5B6UNE6_9ROSI|nr:nucleolin-like [Gossypium australe]
MANIDMVDTNLANLNIMDEEEHPMMIVGEDTVATQFYDMCLVGKVLTNSVVNFLFLKNTLADLWHPLRGVTITEMEDKRILFRFYCKIDLKRVMDGLPWGEDPKSVPLWDTVHNLPIGFTSEETARQIGDFIGNFMEYDASLVTRGNNSFMRIRVLIDISLPLKRRKRIGIGQNRFMYVNFQYERLPLFCFICGRLGHGESYCEVRLILGNQQPEFGWDLSLRAAPRRGGQVVSKWLREDSETNRWKGTAEDGDRSPRKAREGATDNSKERREVGTLGRFTRLGQKNMNSRVQVISKQWEVREDKEDLEDVPVEFVEGKKRQRLIMGDIRGLPEGALEENISAATNKVADLAQ